MKKAKYYNFITALSVGVVVIISLSCVSALSITKVDISDKIIYAVINFVLCAGGLAAGYRYGKLKRNGGICGGIKCGLGLSVIVMIFGILYMRKIFLLRLLKIVLFLCISGAFGGVTGVNSKLRRPPY
jgi:putative membrane protein (TIGR04086 family)